MELMVVYLLAINIVTFLLYGMDKWKAKRNAWRISEKCLLFTAFIGGSAGALAGMYIFHHKTKHISFRLMVPVFFFIHIVLIFRILHG